MATSNANQDLNPSILTIEGPFQPGSGGIPAPQGTRIEVKIPWSEICNKIFNSSGGCDSIPDDQFGRKAIRVGLSAQGNFLNEGDYISNLFIEIHKIQDSEGQTALCNTNDTSAQGLCNFSVFPGDGKAFVDNVRGSCGLPNLPNSNRARQARIFYKEVPEDELARDFPDITSPQFVDYRILSNSGSGTNCVIPLSSPSVGGLKNGTRYTFAIGLVDQASNIGYVTNMTATTGASQPTVADGDTGGCYNPSEPSQTRNCHLVRPDEVVALFRDEFDCFITTAAYGSPTQYQVKTFRQFRNHFLRTNWLGQKIINFYYRTSPPVAKWIRQNPQSQFWVRMMLWPLWIFAQAALTHPLYLLLSLFLLITFPFIKTWRLRR